MYLDQLKQLLADGMTPDNVRRMRDVADEWFMAEPGLRTFFLRSLFRSLASNWEDRQAIPTAEFTPFAERFQPQLTDFLNLGFSTPQESLLAAMDSLVRTFHECILATRRA